MIKESDLDSNFTTIWNGLISQPELQEKLGIEIKKLALPDATKQIVNQLEELLND